MSSTSTAAEPKVGTGATLVYPQDMYPLVIVSVTAHTITVERLRTVSTATGHQPVRGDGYPLWDHTYTPAEIERFRNPDVSAGRAYKRRDGRFYLNGTPLIIGEARYRRDYSY